MQLGLGFMAAKTLLSAVELGLFTLLEQGALSAQQLAERLALHPRAVPDFPDTLVALKLLQREGELYSNTPESAFFLDRNKPSYIGGILEMANARLYPFWSDLTHGLRSGQPQNEIKGGGASLFETLYAEPDRLEQFMHAMAGISAGNAQALARSFDFSPFRQLTDVGGATAVLACTLARAYPQLHCRSFDLPPVKPIAQRRIDSEGLGERVEAVAGDFFHEPLPPSDVITMGMILHDWNLETKRMLIGKAFEALPAGGALVAVEALIDDERRHNAFGLLMSLNMLIETGTGFDYTFADFSGWCREAGFARCERVSLGDPFSAAIAYK